MYQLKGGNKLSSQEESIDVLKSLGLTSCQTKVYLSLLSCGKSTVKSISVASKTPREEVYQVLPKLHSLGLIEKMLERPAKFKAIPLRECVTTLIAKRKNRVYELETRAEELIKNYKSNSAKKESIPKLEFVFVPSKEAIVRKLKNAIDHTEESICVLTSCKRFIYACYSLSTALQRAWNRGVKGKAIINISEENQLNVIGEFWGSPSAEIRYIPNVPRTVIAMYDNREVFIFTNPKADFKESPALWSNYPSLVSIIEDYFKILWSTSMKTPQYYLDSIQP